MGFARDLAAWAILMATSVAGAPACAAGDPRVLLLRGSADSPTLIRHSFRIVPGAGPSNPSTTSGADLVAGAFHLSTGIAGAGSSRLARVNRLVFDPAATSRRLAKGLGLAIAPAQGLHELALEARYLRVRIEDSAPVGAGERLGDMRLGLALHRTW